MGDDQKGASQGSLSATQKEPRSICFFTGELHLCDIAYFFKSMTEIQKHTAKPWPAERLEESPSPSGS